ncbi:MAG: long-chain fatty acid--CoA ligase [Thermoflexales bacterium]|nr:long-chain fatty acid--CoA ligase [Thermoflexales bacterium]
MSDQPWLKFYEPHVPAHLEYPHTILPEVLARVARDHAALTAFIFKGRRLTFGDFNRAVDRFAAALQRLGVKPGDRVAIHLPNCPQFPIAYYGVLRAGAIVVPCNPLYQSHEMTHQLNDSGAEVIVTLSSTYPLIKAIRSSTPLQHVIVAEIKTYFSPVLRLAFTLLKEQKAGHRADISGDANTDRFADVLKSAPAQPQPVAVAPDDIAILMYTGGTTGVSKGAMLTHRNILANAYQSKVWINAADSQDIGLVQLPLFHAYGMTTCLNLAVLTANTLILIPDPRDVRDVIRTIDRFKPTLYPGVPAIYTAINNFPDIKRYDLSSIRVCLSGAAGLPPDVQRQFQAITGARLIEGYGLSEASPIVIGNPAYGADRPGTIGLPWPDVEVKIVDGDTGLQRLGIGEAGELCVRGPQVMKGYWNLPTETANTLRPDPDEPNSAPWLYTGDIAVMDADGYVRIVDRKKDLILSAGGYKIHPREIEDVLYGHPAVYEVAAIGVPHGDKGERVKVFVVLKPDRTATADELIEFCRTRLAPFKIPKIIEFRDALPKSIIGKILRRPLREAELANIDSER